MRTLILAAIASVLLWTNAEKTFDTALNAADWVWVTKIGREPVDVNALSVIQKIRYRAWMELCGEYYRNEDCSDMEVPEIAKFRPNPLRPGLAGYYDGSDTVYIRNDLRGAEREEVILHEMSHYLDVQLNLTVVPGPALDICFSEKRAWRISDLFWYKQGYSWKSSKIIGSKWTNWYRHCTPHQSTLYPDEFPAS